MRNLVNSIVLTIALSLTIAVSANEIGVITNVQTGKTSVDLSTNKQFNNQFGMWAYASQSENWSEAYAGPTYAPNTNIQIGIAAGLESNQKSMRFGEFLWAGKGRTSIFLLSENGGSGEWYLLQVKYQLNNNLNVGVLKEKFQGLGVSAEQNLTKTTKIRARFYKNSTEVSLRLMF